MKTLFTISRETAEDRFKIFPFQDVLCLADITSLTYGKVHRVLMAVHEFIESQDELEILQQKKQSLIRHMPSMQPERVAPLTEHINACAKLILQRQKIAFRTLVRTCDETDIQVVLTPLR